MGERYAWVMGNPVGSAKEKRLAQTVSSLLAYLQDASSSTLPDETFEGDPGQWAAATPPTESLQGPGRVPWIYMRNVNAMAMGGIAIITFQWSLGEDPKATYILPMEVPDWDPTTASDHLITRLDLMLSSATWQDHTHPVGVGAVIVLPSTRSR